MVAAPLHGPRSGIMTKGKFTSARTPVLRKVRFPVRSDAPASGRRASKKGCQTRLVAIDRHSEPQEPEFLAVCGFLRDINIDQSFERSDLRLPPEDGCVQSHRKIAVEIVPLATEFRMRCDLYCEEEVAVRAP